MQAIAGCAAGERIGGQSKYAPLSKQHQPAPANDAHRGGEAGAALEPQLEGACAALERDKIRNRATCAVARKLVAYLMAVDKSGKPYEDRTPEG